METAEVNLQQQTPACHFPTKVDENDTLHFRTIFPDEIWCFILGYLNNFYVYTAVGKASGFLRNLMESCNILRVHVMFSHVAKILVRRCAEKTELTRRLRWLPEKDNYKLAIFAKARQVCKSWRIRTDMTLQAFRCRFSQDQTNIEELWDDDYHFTTIFLTQTDFKEFEAHFKDTHLPYGANPFPAREVVVHVNAKQDERLTMGSECLKFLRKYGHHIAHFIFKCETWTSIQHQCSLYITFKEMLYRIPNLRTLKFHTEDYTLAQAEVEKLLAKPFPTLKQLRCVDLRGVPNNVLLALLSCGPNLKLAGYDLKDMQTLERQSGSRVKVLNVNVKVELDSWSTLFSALEVFGETLTELHLQPQRPNLFKYEDRLKLPRLRKLDIRLPAAFPLDFLLDLRNSLEELTVTADGKIFMDQCPEYSENIIKFYRYVHRLHRSNVWELFSNLQTLKRNYHPWRKRWSCTRIEWRNSTGTIRYV